MGDNSNLEEIASSVLVTMLEPYFKECRYLQRAFVSEDDDCRFSTRGEFSIPSCCYGNGPSHFSAAEFVICFNQLTYVSIAEAVSSGKLPELGMKSVDDFKAAQMERCYIGRIGRITFRKPISTKNFEGRLRIVKEVGRNGTVFYSTQSTFSDEKEGYAEGQVTIAIKK
jgi:hypothetical protein